MGFGNKFFAHKVEYNGTKFDSTLERDRYIFLSDAEERGLIKNLRRQVEYIIIPKQTHVVSIQLKTKIRYEERVLESEAKYTADFTYVLGDRIVVEDTKSSYTRKEKDYVLLRKLLLYHNHIRLVEVYEADAPLGEYLPPPQPKKKREKKQAKNNKGPGLFDDFR